MVSAATTAAFLVALLAPPQAAPTAAPAGEPPAPKVAATFYAWYDHPGAHFTDGTGRDLLRHHFVDPERVHADSPEWFAGELADAADAGLDLLLCASVGSGADTAAAGAPWFEALAAGLERTRGRIARPIGASLLVEPWCLAAAHGGRFDLGDAATRAATLATILAFHRTLRPEDWGRLDGAPLIVFGRVSGGGDGGRGGPAPAAFLADLRLRFREAFGREPLLLLDRTWAREGTAAAGDRTWREGSPLLGPQTAAIASLAPGFDDRRVERPLGVVRPREGGRLYEAAWSEVVNGPPPELVVVESWNQFHDGTAIAPALEHGRRYVELTRRYADLLRAGGRAEPRTPRFDGVVSATDFAEERVFSTRDDVAFRPGDEPGGIELRPDVEARLAFVTTKKGDVLEVRPREKGGVATLRFDVSDAFPAAASEPFEATVRYTVTLDAAKVEWVGAGEDAAEAGATRTARFAVAALPRPGAAGGVDLELRVRGGPIALESIELRRKRHRLRAESGEPAPFRRIVLDWRELEPEAGRFDDAKLRERLGLVEAASRRPPDEATARECAVVVLQSPPAWALPVGQHPDEVAATVARVVAAMAEEPALRFLEIFPRANRDGVLGKVADIQGYVRVLRAAATAAHAAAPNVALVLGAIEGPDVPWLRTIQALRQPFSYDAATFEWTVESGTPGDATCGREFERMLAQWRAGGDGEKPFFVTRDPGIGVAAPDGATPTRAIAATMDQLPALVRFAWARLHREAGPVAVLDEEALPLVHGAPGATVVAALKSEGIEASALAAPALEAALDGGVPSTVVLAQGELFPEPLAPKVAAFVDRGGLVVTFGGAPFRRPAQRAPDGGFTLRDESPIGMELRDQLRIEVAPFVPGPWAVAATAAGIVPRIDGAGGVAAWFIRRAGRPRELKGIHRFESLLEVRKGDATLGSVAALLTYSADRKGALLLIGAEGGGRIFDEATARSIVEAMHALAKRCGALASFAVAEEDPRK